jgi:hypothetical protein
MREFKTLEGLHADFYKRLAEIVTTYNEGHRTRADSQLEQLEGILENLFTTLNTLESKTKQKSPRSKSPPSKGKRGGTYHNGHKSQDVPLVERNLS